MSLRFTTLIFAAFTGLAVLLTWPLAQGLGSHVPSDVGDPVLNTWILWWNAHHVPLTDAWWNAPAFYPARGVLGFSEHLLGLTFISSPIIWLSGNPQLAYNITLLLTFSLSATTAALLAYELTGRRDAAILCGLAFGFAPYRMAHFSHLQVLASFWMPLALLGLHRFLRLRERKWLALFGGAWLMQALTNGYYLAFLSVLVGLWIGWFVRPSQWRAGVAIVLAWCAAALPLIPVLLEYRDTHAYYGFVRSIEETRLYSADLLSWLDAPPNLVVWGRWLHAYSRAESHLFPGFTVIVMAVIAIAVAYRRRRAAAPPAGSTGRSAAIFYALAAVMMFGFAMGPAPTLAGEPFLSAGPYSLLAQLPGFSSLRVPSRFAMTMALCLSVAVGVGFGIWSAAWLRMRRLLTAALVAVAILAESWIKPLPLWERPHDWDIQAAEIPGAMLVLPIINEWNEVGSMYTAMAHGRPLVNGYSGFFPPWYRTLKEVLNDQDPEVLDELALAGVTQIAIVLRSDRGGAWRDYVLTRGSFARVSGDGRFALYNLPPPVRPARTLGRRVPIQSAASAGDHSILPAMIDGDLGTRWHSNGTQVGRETVLLDLGSPQRISGIEMALGTYAWDHPRDLVIQTSDDLVAWTDVWRGRTGAKALGALFRQPTVAAFTIDTGDHVTRYVRLQQVGRTRAASWTIAELKVLASDPP